MVREEERQMASVLDRLGCKLISWLPYMSFSFMAYSTVTAIYDYKNDPADLACIVGSFTLLSLLYFSMWAFEKTRGSPSPTKHLVLKAIILALAVILATVFSSRVTTIVTTFLGLGLQTTLLLYSPGANPANPWMMNVWPNFLRVALFISVFALIKLLTSTGR